MKAKTKAIIAVIIVACVALGYFFIDTTASIEQTFNKVGKIAVLVLIVALAIAAIVLINKAKKAADERAAAKAKKKEMKEKPPIKEEVLDAQFKEIKEAEEPPKEG